MLVADRSHRLFEALASKHTPKKIVILGSTGSIGVSALDIIKEHPKRFEVYGLVAGSNAELLNGQISEFNPTFAGLSNKEAASRVTMNNGGALSGMDEICDLVTRPEVDLIIASIVGMAGLRPVMAALTADKIVALANKESLVAGGPFLSEIITNGQGALLPIDSEHSAIFQAIQGEDINDINRLILTASGGPFLKRTREELYSITPQEAVKHPRWNMGPKISVDSATMMNKALELIEAYWLFGIDAERIHVVVHPQSIVHSLVEYNDGSQIAQLSNPDMKGPISLALSYPEGRVKGAIKSLDLTSIKTLEFLPLADERFPALTLAREALRAGHFAPAVFNSANEAAVDLFLNGKLAFDRIEEVVSGALACFSTKSCASITDLLELDGEVRASVLNFTGR